MGLSTQLVLLDLDCRQQLQYGQQWRNVLVCGAGVQNVCAITLFKSPWPIRSSLLLLSSFHGGRSDGEIRCPSKSVWRRPCSSVNASVNSGKGQAIEQLWEEYFADPSQWWDNRVDQIKYGALQSHVGYHASSSQGIPQSNRLSKSNTGGGNSNIHMQGASTMAEAIMAMKNRLEQCIAVDPYMYVKVLKKCLKQKDLVGTKQVHDCIMESRMEQNTYVANNLMSVYIRCGRLQEARQVFDELVMKDVFSWTIMIGGYAQHKHGEDAMGIFNRMCQEGVQPNEITYSSILKAFASPSALKWGKEVHACIRHGGFESDVRVGTSLVKMYAKCGSIKEARQTFEDLINRNVFSWNVMIGAYAESGCGVEAYRLFLQMKREGFKPDAITFMSILNASASTEALEWVKQVHNHALEAGFESDLRVGNALVHMYAKSGSINDARLVFNRMKERDVITWTAMTGGLAQHGFGREAYELFLQMKHEGFKPDAMTYVSILNACASTGALEWVKKVHSYAMEAGFESDLRVGNALVHMYAKSGSINDAQLVFNRMKERDVITWTAMTGGLAQHGCAREAYELFLQMKREGFKANAVIYVNILNASASTGAMEWVKKVHSHILEAGLESDFRVGSTLFLMYVKNGNIDDAQQVFNRMKERDVITWTVMIGGLAQHGRGHEAYELLLQMPREGCIPNAITYASILNPAASAGALEWVKEVHRQAFDAGLESDLRLRNALIHMYAKSGSIDDARRVFDRTEESDVITWTVMIGGLAQHGCGYEALQIFGEMKAHGVKPNGHTFVAVLSACSHSGLVDAGRSQYLAMTQAHGIEPDVQHCTCMVDLLGRAGHLEEAKLFIGDMPVEPNAATWGALLGACRTYGNVEVGELAAKERLKLVPEDDSTYVALSNIYAAAGKWEEASFMRTMMEKRGIHKQPGHSWIGVDNEIHEFVAGDTSHRQSKEIYKELNRLSEKLKAQGYIPDTRLVLKNIEEHAKEVTLCSHSEKLAIAYGLLRIPAGEPIRVYKNLRVCTDCHTATKFISKVTGREIVARDAHRFHHFKDGECSCSDYW